jgi:hypothetical protein
VKQNGTYLLIGGLFVAAGFGMYAWVNLTTGVGPGGGHSGLIELAGLPFVAVPIAGLIAAITGVVLIVTANVRRR